MSDLRRLLVSAGPTHEPIDDVRYLANRSSGKLGCAVAREARAQGLEVDLVLGPVALPDPEGCTVIRVETALEMQAALERRFEACDALVMAAAVADFRPAQRITGKLKKEEGRDDLTLHLTKNPDILQGLAARRAHQFLVGFALEADLDLEQAERKRQRKGVDLLVLDGPSTLGADRSTFCLLDGIIAPVWLRDVSKDELARELVERVVSALERR